MGNYLFINTKMLTKIFVVLASLLSVNTTVNKWVVCHDTWAKAKGVCGANWQKVLETIELDVCLLPAKPKYGHHSAVNATSMFHHMDDLDNMETIHYNTSNCTGDFEKEFFKIGACTNSTMANNTTERYTLVQKAQDCQ